MNGDLLEAARKLGYPTPNGEKILLHTHEHGSCSKLTEEDLQAILYYEEMNSTAITFSEYLGNLLK